MFVHTQLAWLLEGPDALLTGESALPGQPAAGQHKPILGFFAAVAVEPTSADIPWCLFLQLAAAYALRQCCGAT
jgi:hypothetical protein